MSLSRLWIAIAGTALVLGGVAWMLKLWVIVATDGRVVATGAAGTFFDLSFYLLIVGCTGLGLRLAINEDLVPRVGMALGFSFVYFVAFFMFSGIGYSIVALGRAISS